MDAGMFDLKKHWSRQRLYLNYFMNSGYRKFLDYSLIAVAVGCMLVAIYKHTSLLVFNKSTLSHRVTVSSPAHLPQWWRRHALGRATSLTYLQAVNDLAQKSGVTLSDALLVKTKSVRSLISNEYALDMYGSWKNDMNFLQHLDVLPGVQSLGDCKFDVSKNGKLRVQLQIFNWQRKFR
jgi:hypothetical protein